MSGHVADGAEILGRIAERRGSVLGVHPLMAELDPDFLDLFDEMYVHTLGYKPIDEGSIPAMYRELICACACAIVAAPESTIARHLRRAYELGLTEQQAIEGFHSLLIPVGGLPIAAALRAMIALRTS